VRDDVAGARLVDAGDGVRQAGEAEAATHVRRPQDRRTGWRCRHRTGGHVQRSDLPVAGPPAQHRIGVQFGEAGRGEGGEAGVRFEGAHDATGRGGGVTSRMDGRAAADQGDRRARVPQPPRQQHAGEAGADHDDPHAALTPRR
jgi:hypothetical protein